MDFILKLKNWQLFLIIFLFPFTIGFGLIAFIEFNYNNESLIMGIVSIIYYAIFVLWNYKVIKTFNRRVRILKLQQIKRLDLSLIVLPIYAVFLLFPDKMFFNDDILLNILSPIFIILMTYAFFFMVFCTAKTLKGLQLKDQLRTADIIIEMLLILYFPLGIWSLQKRVNRFFIDLPLSENN